MPSYWKHVNQVLIQADIIIEVLDARMVGESRNEEIERKIARSGKRILYVVNKCDLVDVGALPEQLKTLQPSVYISSTDKLGTTILKKKILEMSKGEEVTVGVVGYPNVGKSSLINALAGRNAARTSPQSGFTQGLQKVRVSPKIVLLDTPGVLPFKERDIQKHGLLGAVDYDKIRDPEMIALQLMTEKPDLIRRTYKLTEEDPELMLEELARKLKKLRKKGELDTAAAARALLKDWQTGKVK